MRIPRITLQRLHSGQMGEPYIIYTAKKIEKEN